MRQAYDYWQDQPGNCPTRTDPPTSGSRTRQRVPGLAPLPRPEFSHRPIKVVPPPQSSPSQPTPFEATRRARTAARVPSPPISHASEALPQSCGLESTPSVETTDERPPSRGCRDAAYLPSASVADTFGPRAIRSTPLGVARRGVVIALRSLLSFRLEGGVSSPVEPGHSVPSQAGTSCTAGASTTRTRDGQPSPSGFVSFDRATLGASRRSRHRSPGGPSTHFVPTHRPARVVRLLATGRSLQGRGPFRAPQSGVEGLSPSSPTTLPLGSVAPPQPQPSPSRLTTLGVLLHFASAHPPCSRKGPLLPACGLKRPRRVKRETTNSRFCVFRGLWQNSSGQFRFSGLPCRLRAHNHRP